MRTDPASSCVDVRGFQFRVSIADLVEEPLADILPDSLPDQLAVDLDTGLASAAEPANQGPAVRVIVQKAEFEATLHHALDDGGGLLGFSTMVGNTPSSPSVQNRLQAGDAARIAAQMPGGRSLEIGLRDGGRRLFPLPVSACRLGLRFFVESFGHGPSRPERKFKGGL